MSITIQVWHVLLALTLVIWFGGDLLVKRSNPYGGLGALADGYIYGSICVGLTLILWLAYFAGLAVLR